MPYENFTTYTEVDPNSDITLTSDTCSFDTLDNGANAWVYKDKGIDHFDGDFEHTIDVEVTAQSGGYGRVFIWSMTNNITDFKSCSDALGVVFDHYGGNEWIRLYERNSSTEYETHGSYDYNTVYYLTIKRDETIGTYGRLYCYIYSDSDRTTLLDTLQLDLHEKVDFRYIFCLQRQGGAGTGSTITGYAKNLSLAIIPTFEDSDTLTLSDAIELNLSLEKAETSESVTLSDEIHVAFSIQQELADIMALSDVIDISLSKDLSDTLTLADAITVDTVEPSVNDFDNIFGMVEGTIEDIANKFGTLAQNKLDVNNKVGFLKSFQIAGDAGYQSLGKTYIKVYINSVEQTDMDIDSITITKSLNSPHTASFILGRPYDNSKPSQESEVEIKYHIWTLYKGYITQITPTDSPDTIRINCQDKYWKQNKTKKYFSVGHKPTDNQELYYNTISEGLSACGASFGIGNFIPQTMNLFGNGESDCISNLVTNAGNFGWYYDIDNTKKLWIAGQGDIIYLEKQELGINLGLYQVLRQSFKESIDRIVNKFRVQMGDFVWRRFDDIGGVKEYAGTRLSQYLGQIFPKWNSSYERLATSNYEPAYLDENNDVVAQVGTSGVFRHSVEENDLYKDVFVKYDLPGLNPDFESWNDKVSPHIIVRFPFFAGWKLSGSLKSPEIGWSPLGFRYELSEGFTIDYEKGEVIFNEPVYLYQSNADGEITNIKKAKLEIAIYKERYYSNTEDPSADPETDISNPLMFFTEKYGDYPETIIENLNLSGLGIQIGGWEIVGRDDNNKPIYRYTPSWNDTAFAVDLANWRLTQNCDKKVSGSVEVTLDTICFYDINLSNRIMIEGVIEDPLNITSISYNIGSWRVSLGLENGRYYKRNVSIQSRGE